MLVCLCQLFSLTWPFTSDTLPEGLVRELPSADKSQELPTSEAPLTSNDDLEDLRRQLEALNSWYPQQFPTHHANFFTKLKIFIDSIFVTWFVIFCLSFGEGVVWGYFLSFWEFICTSLDVIHLQMKHQILWIEKQDRDFNMINGFPFCTAAVDSVFPLLFEGRVGEGEACKDNESSWW